MNPEHVMRALVDVGRPLILEEARADSCILSTKIAIETFEHFGIKAQPVAVDVVALNAVAAKVWRECSATPGWYPEQMHPDQTPGAWGIGLGFRKEHDECGHVVAVVGDDMLTLFDLSIDQASRPQHGIHLRPQPFVLQPTFWDGHVMRFIDDTGAELHYRLSEDRDPWWTRSGNWQRRDKARRARIVGAAIREARRLATEPAHAD